MRRIVFAFLCAILFLAVAPFTLARVTRVEITTREDINGGKPFGLAGPCERLIGVAAVWSGTKLRNDL